jgi:hypothetical protein
MIRVGLKRAEPPAGYASWAITIPRMLGHDTPSVVQPIDGCLSTIIQPETGPEI